MSWTNDTKPSMTVEFLVTEILDFLMTESNDFLITNQSNVWDNTIKPSTTWSNISK